MGARRSNLAEVQKVQDARPSWASIEARWPGSVVTHVDGRREATVPLNPDSAEGRRNRADVFDMVAPSARLETEASQERAATTDHGAIVEARHERAGRARRPGLCMSGPAWDRFFAARKRKRGTA